jgi:hypothetical protein
MANANLSTHFIKNAPTLHQFAPRGALIPNVCQFVCHQALFSYLHLLQKTPKATEISGFLIVSILLFMYGGGEPYRIKCTISILDYRHIVKKQK